jgi:condensin complex subunit 2
VSHYQPKTAVALCTELLTAVIVVDAAAAAPKVARTAKAPFTIDFNAPSTAATSSKTLFAPAPRSSLTLPSAAKAARRRSSKRSIGDSKKRKEEWLLPDDMHFSSRQLLRLFLKPKFAVS